MHRSVDAVASNVYERNRTCCVTAWINSAGFDLLSTERLFIRCSVAHETCKWSAMIFLYLSFNMVSWVFLLQHR